MFKIFLKHKIATTIVVALVIIIGLGVYQVRTLNKAHSSFDNYYAFRGCKKLITRTPTYGTCVTGSGQTIKIVLYKGKWYLDGDLPIGILGHLL